MERFEEVLDQYIDLEEIECKRKIDFEEDNLIREDKKSSRRIKKFSNTITIKEFVNYYLNTTHDCQNLKHKGLKSFCNPYIIGISNDFALKNPDCVIRNEIVVVIDAYGNLGTYINPNLLKQLKSMEEYKHALRVLQKIRLYDLARIDNLYREYIYILEKINEFEKVYIDGCDLLMTLEKKTILNKIRKYVKQFDYKKIEIVNEQNRLSGYFDVESSLLEHIEQIIEGETYSYSQSKRLREEKYYDKYKG